MSQTDVASVGSAVKSTQKHRIFHYLRIQHFEQESSCDEVDIVLGSKDT